jgi:hypothetical protein
MNREEERRQRKKRKRKIKSTGCDFMLCRWLKDPPPAGKGRGEEAEPDSLFPVLFSLWRVNPRAASSGARGGDAPPLFRCPEDVPSTVPADPRRCSQQFLEFLGFIFVIFELYLIYFKFCYFRTCKMMNEMSIVKSNVWVCLCIFFFMYVL